MSRTTTKAGRGRSCRIGGSTAWTSRPTTAAGQRRDVVEAPARRDPVRPGGHVQLLQTGDLPQWGCAPGGRDGRLRRRERSVEGPGAVHQSRERDVAELEQPG